MTTTVLGMTRKRTFSLPDEVSDQLDRVAPENASAFVTDAVRAKIERDAAAERIKDAYGEPDPVAYAFWVGKLAGGRSGQRAS